MVDSLDSGSSVHCGRAGSSPASPTKETVERLSLFCQSILAKTVKTPNFPRSNGELGAFYVLGPMLIYLQLFLPIFPKRVGAVAAEDARKRKMAENLKKDVTYWYLNTYRG